VNKAITRLAVFGVALMTALIVGTTYWQTWAAPGLADRRDNAIQRVAQFTIKRGTIYAGDGKTVIAANVTRRVQGKTFYFRRYPQRGLFAHAVGYSTQARSRAGLERSQNDYLTASNANLNTLVDKTFDQLRGATIEGNDLVTTLNPRGQRAALEALGGRCGSIVVLEPATGRVLVMASSPTYDPNLVEGEFERIARIGADCSRPSALLNRATDGLYAPGSTFKVVTGAAALESGRIRLETTFSDPGYCEEYGRRVNNYDTTRPFGTVNFLQAMQYSVNSVFCNIGKRLGGLSILARARRFGFYSEPPLETPTGERSPSGLYRNGEPFFPKDPNAVDPGRLAFGQERLLVTPFQLAMVVAAVANRGELMRPFLVSRIVAPDGDTVTRTKPDRLGRAISEETAADLTEAMKAVVADGTGTRAQLPGIAVAGKTGTAETGRAGVNTAAFIAFAPAEQPRIAIAVVLEEQRGTGGQLAAPVAQAVMQALLHPSSNPA